MKTLNVERIPTPSSNSRNVSKKKSIILVGSIFGTSNETTHDEGQNEMMTMASVVPSINESLELVSKKRDLPKLKFGAITLKQQSQENERRNNNKDLNDLSVKQHYMLGQKQFDFTKVSISGDETRRERGFKPSRN